ncbi:MAG TPA: hypothetical protein VF494_05500 [Candidatus Limnocylindrales bacterium]
MTSPHCPAEFNGPVRAGIIAAIRTAYDEADEIYAPERGRGDHLHGLAVYHVASFELRNRFEDQAGARFVSHGHGPELHVGPYRLRWNKVARGTGQSIRGSFPRGSRAAALMAAENHQLVLFDEAALEPGGFPVNWIIAHMGNPTDHLVAIYLAAPIDTDGQSVTGWRDVVPIWSVIDPESEFPSAPEPGLPEPVALGDLDVALRNDEDASAEEA